MWLNYSVTIGKFPNFSGPVSLLVECGFPQYFRHVDTLGFL